MLESQASSSEFEFFCMSTVCLYDDVHVREMYSLCVLYICFPDSSVGDGEEGKEAYP